MDFTAIDNASNQLYLLIRAIAVALMIVIIAVCGLMWMTSFGNEHRVALVRTAAIAVIIGIFVVLGAPFLADLLKGLFSFLPSPAPVTPTPAPK